MGKWSLSPLNLPLRVTWKIARNTTNAKTNFLISYQQGSTTGYGETAFNVRYGESVKSIKESFQLFSKEIALREFDNFKEFSRFLDSINLPNSLRFGIECSWLDWFSSYVGKSQSDILKLNSPKKIDTSFSIPIIESKEVVEFINKFNLRRFSSLKLKVSGAENIDLVQAVLKHTTVKIRIDGNEGFQSVNELTTFLDQLPHERIEFIEQPLPSNKNHEQAKLKGRYSFPFVADESLTNQNVEPDLAQAFDAVNIKLMKSGSILRALDQKKQALDLGMQLMLGCMVETSMAIRYGILLGEDISWFDLDGHLLLDKDPFNLIQETNGRLEIKSKL